MKRLSVWNLEKEKKEEKPEIVLFLKRLDSYRGGGGSGFYDYFCLLSIHVHNAMP